MYNKSDYSHWGSIPVYEENIGQIVHHMNCKYDVLMHKAIFKEYNGYVSVYLHKHTSLLFSELKKEIKKMNDEMKNGKDMNRKIYFGCTHVASDEIARRIVEKMNEKHMPTMTFSISWHNNRAITVYKNSTENRSYIFKEIKKMEKEMIENAKNQEVMQAIRDQIGQIDKKLDEAIERVVKLEKPKEEEPVKKWHFFFDDEEKAREVYYLLHIADIEKYNMKRVNSVISFESKRSETKLVDALINHAADLVDKSMAEKAKKYTHYYTCCSKAEALDIMAVIDAMKKTGFDISWNGDHKIKYHAENNAKRENIWHLIAGIDECRKYYK